jgi:hypothetical protein
MGGQKGGLCTAWNTMIHHCATVWPLRNGIQQFVLLVQGARGNKVWRAWAHIGSGAACV